MLSINTELFKSFLFAHVTTNCIKIAIKQRKTKFYILYHYTWAINLMQCHLKVNMLLKGVKKLIQIIRTLVIDQTAFWTLELNEFSTLSSIPVVYVLLKYTNKTHYCKQIIQVGKLHIILILPLQASDLHNALSFCILLKFPSLQFKQN